MDMALGVCRLAIGQMTISQKCKSLGYTTGPWACLRVFIELSFITIAQMTLYQKKLWDTVMGPGKITAPLSAFHNILSATLRFL